MTTPNPALIAAAPSLITALTQLQTMVKTIITGDPALAAARALPAAEIFLAQLELLGPGLLTAELGVGATVVETKITGLIASLQALLPKSA